MLAPILGTNSTYLLQHRNVIPPDEYTTLETSITTVISALDAASNVSQDPISRPPLVLSWQGSTGRRGRPRKDCDPQFLAFAMDLRGPSGIAPVLGWSSKTVSRRALEYGLREPGTPVFRDYTHEDGSISRIHQSTTRPMSNITDEQLDHLVFDILQVFPHFGRSMLHGRLQAMGHHVPRERLRLSYIRVHGVPGVFGDRTIQRKKYSVAGANSLWHHDGQHGKISYSTYV